MYTFKAGLFSRGKHCDDSVSGIMMTLSNGNISALLALSSGNSPVTGEFPPQRPVTQSFDVFCHLWLNKQLSKQLGGWWFETPSHPLSRHSNDNLEEVARVDHNMLLGGRMIFRHIICLDGLQQTSDIINNSWHSGTFSVTAAWITAKFPC